MTDPDAAVIVATVTAVFGVADNTAAGEVADELLEHDEVVTVRIGRGGERSVYRVDVPAGDDAWQAAALRPGEAVAAANGIDLEVIAVTTGDDYDAAQSETPPGGQLPPE